VGKKKKKKVWRY